MDPTQTTSNSDNTTAQGAAANGGATGSSVPASVAQKYPELVAMIQKTESMSEEEREYWFQILPIMTEEQVVRLKKILEDEAAQLAKLDAEYKDELSKLNKKHLEEWDTLEKDKERKALQAAEEATHAEEAKAEEDLLKQIENS